jgi:hypothetical protein
MTMETSRMHGIKRSSELSGIMADRDAKLQDITYYEYHTCAELRQSMVDGIILIFEGNRRTKELRTFYVPYGSTEVRK